MTTYYLEELRQLRARNHHVVPEPALHQGRMSRPAVLKHAETADPERPLKF